MPAKVFIEVAPRFELDGGVIKVWHRAKGKDGEIVETGSCSFATLDVAVQFHGGLLCVIQSSSAALSDYQLDLMIAQLLDLRHNRRSANGQVVSFKGASVQCHATQPPHPALQTDQQR